VKLWFVKQGVVVRWVLGKHNNGNDPHLPRLLHLASTSWIAKQNLTPGPLLEAPLARSVYRAAAGGGVRGGDVASAAQPWWFDHQEGEDTGGDLLLVDDDSGVNLELLQLFVVREAQSVGLKPPWPQVVPKVCKCRLVAVIIVGNCGGDEGFLGERKEMNRHVSRTDGLWTMALVGEAVGRSRSRRHHSCLSAGKGLHRFAFSRHGAQVGTRISIAR